jgi:hypothetical protein
VHFMPILIQILAECRSGSGFFPKVHKKLWHQIVLAGCSQIRFQEQIESVLEPLVFDTATDLHTVVWKIFFL